MANVYLKAGGTGGGTSWSDSYTGIQAAINGAGAGGIVYMDSAFSESVSATITYPASSNNNPVRIIRVDSTGSPEPPTDGDYKPQADETTPAANIDVTTGSLDVGSTGTSSNGAIWYGVGFINTATGDIRLRPGDNGFHKFHKCYFELQGGSANDFMLGSDGSGSWVIFEQCIQRVGHADSDAELRTSVHVVYREHTITGTTPNFLVANMRSGSSVEILGMDITTAMSGGGALVAGNENMSGALVTGVKRGSSQSAISGDPNFFGPVLRSTSEGSAASQQFSIVERSTACVVTDDQTTYRNATYDGTNGYSLNLAGTSDVMKGAGWPAQARVQIAELWADADATVKVHALSNSGTAFDHQDWWFEVEHPDPTDAMRVVITKVNEDPDLFLGTPGSYSAPSAPDGWTSPPSPVSYYSPSVTLDSSAGIIRVFVIYGHATVDLWVDPEIDVT